MWDYLYLFLISGDVAHCEMSDRVIESRESDVSYPQGVQSDIQLDDDSTNRRLNSAVHLGVITVEIECARWTHRLIVILRLRSKG